jgi:hypothetical protein
MPAVAMTSPATSTRSGGNSSVPTTRRPRRSGTTLAQAFRDMGRYADARELDQDLLDRRRVLGEDHPSTRVSASNLADDLRALSQTEG